MRAIAKKNGNMFTGYVDETYFGTDEMGVDEMGAVYALPKAQNKRWAWQQGRPTRVSSMSLDDCAPPEQGPPGNSRRFRVAGP